MLMYASESPLMAEAHRGFPTPASEPPAPLSTAPVAKTPASATAGMTPTEILRYAKKFLQRSVLS